MGAREAVKLHYNARPGNGSAIKHGAYGLEKRLQLGLSLTADEVKQKREILVQMSFDPDNLPAGPLGIAIERTAANVLLAYRTEYAANWAAEHDPDAWPTLAQRSGWRNDKVIGQLLELAKLQQSGDALVIDAIQDARAKNE